MRNHHTSRIRESVENILDMIIDVPLCPRNEMVRNRILSGRLAADDLAAISRVNAEWLQRSSCAPDDASAQDIANLLLSAINLSEPVPESQFGEDEEKAAAEMLELEASSRRLLASASLISAADLGSRNFEPVRWVIQGIIPEGLSLLSAPPKAGKSWLALDFLVAVAIGGKALGEITVERGRSLYVSLEDSPRRLKNRLEKLGGEFPLILDLVTDRPPATSLPDFLRAYLTLNDRVALVVVDTLGRALRSDMNDYSGMTTLLDPLQRLALTHHISILLIHHVRKGRSDADGDPFDSSLGSQGIIGVMDTALILDRRRGADEALLHVVGREVQDAELPLRLDVAHMRWVLSGRDPGHLRAGPERTRILELLMSSPRPLKTGEIAKLTETSPSNAFQHLAKLHADGLIDKPGTGKWTIRNATKTTESTKSSKTVRSGAPPPEKDLADLALLVDPVGGYCRVGEPGTPRPGLLELDDSSDKGPRRGTSLLPRALEAIDA